MAESRPLGEIMPMLRLPGRGRGFRWAKSQATYSCGEADVVIASDNLIPRNSESDQPDLVKLERQTWETLSMPADRTALAVRPRGFGCADLGGWPGS